jgi:hypothetical protein
MKIISGFKDYYDFVSYIYGGGDPKLVYLRTKVADSKEPGNNALTYQIDGSNVPPFPIFKEKNMPWQFKWCVLNGKFYLLVKRAKFQDDFGNWHFDFDKGYNGYTLLTKSHPCTQKLRPWNSGPYYSKQFDVKDVMGISEQWGTKLAKIVGAPAFTISYLSRFNPNTYVDSIIPNLGELGFGSLFSPEKLYQEIAMFLGNVIRESPDANPPASISDKDRLKQRGFDPVTSFRGKVK